MKNFTKLKALWYYYKRGLILGLIKPKPIQMGAKLLESGR